MFWDIQEDVLGDVLGHPVFGNSWEGFVIENLLACVPECFRRISTELRLEQRLIRGSPGL